MSRSYKSILALAAVTALFLAGCGGDDDSSNTIDAAAQDVGSQTETGTGVGRGRGGGGLEEADGGGLDSFVESMDGGQVVDATVKADATVTVDLPPACDETPCKEINARYQAAVNAAKSCLSTAENQCALSALSSLVCGKSVPVNEIPNSTDILKDWKTTSCDRCRPTGKCLGSILPPGIISCQKNARITPAQTVGSNAAILDPGISVLPPLIFNDGTCITTKLTVGL